MSSRKYRLNHQRRVQLLAFFCGVPGALAAVILLLQGDYSAKVHWTVFLLVGSAWGYFYLRLQAQFLRPLQTATNMLSALREGDFSLQASHVGDTDPLGELMQEINRLTKILSAHRMDAIEAHSLMEKVLERIDAAVFTFDPDRRLTLANPAALKLLGSSREQLKRCPYAAELDLDSALDGPADAVIGHPLDHRNGRFTVRKGNYRVDGRPHELLILIDVSKTLREEELSAWKRLIRVLGHELNNSMAPIRSLSESLQKIAAKPQMDAEDREDLLDGLEIIRQRAVGLNRFIGEYTRLAKLPPPQRQPVELRPMMERLVSLSQQAPVTIADDAASVTLMADPDQLEQACLNLLKNACEAAHETAGEVHVSWRAGNAWLDLYIDDTGHGIANPDNLFIPFFSTKKEGSGIGLTLSRQIIEGHDGSLKLENRSSGCGCRATVSLPIGEEVVAPAE